MRRRETQRFLLMQHALGAVHSQCAARQDACAQAAVAFERLMDTRSNGFVHPVTGAALLAAFKLDTLQGEALADQCGQVNSCGQNVSPEPGWI